MPLVASCPTATCSFKKYLSLTVCAKVKDVSQFLNVSTIASGEGGFKDNSHTRTYSAALPNGIHLRTTATYSLWTQPGNASSLSFHEDAGYPAALANHFIIHSRAADNDSSPFSPESTDKTRQHQHQQPEFGALEVLIYMCINEYDTSVKEGKSRTQQRTLSSSLLKDEQGRVREIPKLHCPTLRSGSDTVDCIMPSTYNSQEASTNLSFPPGIDQNQEYAN
ncbi:unnamed protein product [Clonostachys rhizophaga]|uniref:Uncharacterized protein n=1 Tax=Clonostachys rhizophaga TaxID=160324 RepID=A0A9N9VC52_9HYPO|nr:unnamed protein product [Clonostachys rhizophaga]